MTDLKALIRPHLLGLKPYASARDDYSGTEGIFLDANENSLGSTAEKQYNRYPDPYQRSIKEKIAIIKKTETQNIFLGNGSDEAIDLLFRLFCEPGLDNVITMPPTYGMYAVSAAIHNVNVQEVPLTPEYEIDESAVMEAIDRRTKLIWICSPNNPTGNLLSQKSIERIITQFQGIVIIDEAYHDFTTKSSMLEKLAEYDNLVVLQTFSKAWGLAAVRLGAAYANPELISYLNKIKPPYNIPQPTQEVLFDALDQMDRMKEMVAQILSNKAVLESELKLLPIVQSIVPSDANFLLVKFQQVDEIFNFLLERKIILRNRSNVTLCEGGLRITVGTEPENKMLMNALREFASL